MLYPIAIERGDDTNAHGIIVPDVVGCFSASDTYDGIFEMANEAILSHLELLVEEGEEIPMATSIENHIDNPDYDGMTWALVPVDIGQFLGKAEKINVTLPSRLIHEIDIKVARNKGQYKNRSAYLAKLAERDLIAR